ncbi:MAG TPA: hypothetical protein VGR16_04355 [Thermomicrobiales bacterium]|nr:hypothetical protein [Thermomicrobiales bacterium]
MLPKVGASYLAKRFADQILAPPAKPAEPEQADADLDGQMFYDDEGQRIGRAFRIPDLAVYVIAPGPGNLQAELEQCIAEPESRLFFRTEEGRITGLIYAADPSRSGSNAGATRSDEV